MAAYIKLFLAVALIVAMAQIGAAAVKCYECTGDDCKDPFDEEKDGVTTKEGCTYCSKGKTDDTVVRVCAPVGTIDEDKCEENNGSELCVCKGELCNSATHLRLGAVFFLFPLTALIASF